MGSPAAPAVARRVGPTQEDIIEVLSRNAVLGRYNGPEQINAQTVALATGTVPFVRLDPFSLRRPLFSVDFELAFRLTQTVAPFVNVSPEAPQNIVQRITIKGQHVRRGSQTLVDMTGASAYVYPNHFQIRGGQTWIGVNGAIPALAAPPGAPFVSPFTGAIATHDVRLIYRVPLVPITGQSPEAQKQMVNYLLYPADWQNTLIAELTFGDGSAFGTVAGTQAFTAFQNAAGLPLLTTFLNYASLSPRYQNMSPNPGFLLRSERLIQTLLAAATNVELARLDKLNTNSIIVKTGTLQAAVTGGVQTFTTLSDAILNQTRLLLDGRPIKDVSNNFVQRAYVSGQIDTQPMEGYYPIDFLTSRDVLTSLRGDNPAWGTSTLQLNTDVLTAVAAQRMTVIQEEVLGGIYAPIR